MKKQKKKIMWLDVWSIEEQEAWFSDMATKGWKLIGLNKWFAIYEECEPMKLKFRCDVFKINAANPSEDERIEFYKSAGWEYVGSRLYVQIFREMDEKDVNPMELHTDPVQQGETITILKNNIKTRALLTVLLSVIMIFLAYFTLQISPVNNYLENDFLSPMMQLLTFAYLSFIMVGGMLHLSKLKAKLQSGRPLDHNVDYKGKLNRNRVLGTSIIILLSLWVVTVFSNLFITITEERFPEIPNHELPIVQIYDLLDNTDYVVATSEDEDGDRYNYYNESSSILVPRQYELRQKVEVPGTMWDDNSGTYSPTLMSYGYEVRTEALAKNLVRHLKYTFLFFQDAYDLVPHPELDELWIISDALYATEFIARKENRVYQVIYFGMEPVERVLEKTIEKAGQQQ